MRINKSSSRLWTARTLLALWFCYSSGLTAWAEAPADDTSGEPKPTPAVELSSPTLGQQAVEADSMTEMFAEANAQQGSNAAGQQMLANNIRTVKKGTSSWLAKKAALKQLPLAQMSAPSQQVTQSILSDLSLFRELPTLEFETDPRVYSFFLSHPDVAVSIWRAMGVSAFQMWQTSQTEFKADAGDGTTGDVALLYTDSKQCVVSCSGVYDSPLLVKPIHARALLHLQTTIMPSQTAAATIRHSMTMYVAFPSSAVETTAKLISPISNRIVDRNFYEVSLFVSMMSSAMEQQPGWVEQLTGKLDDVHEARKSQLMQVTAEVYVASRKRKLASKMDPAEITAEQVMAPLRVASQKQ